VYLAFVHLSIDVLWLDFLLLLLCSHLSSFFFPLSEGRERGKLGGGGGGDSGMA